MLVRLKGTASIWNFFSSAEMAPRTRSRVADDDDAAVLPGGAPPKPRSIASYAGWTFAATLYVTGIPLFTPAIPILLMQCVPPNRRGAVMGLDSAVNAVARIATPIALGGVYHASPTAAFAAAGGVVAFACALVLVRRWMVMGPGMKFGGVGSAR